MAKKTTFIIIDDVDGKELPDDGFETVRWGLDGKLYEFDTSVENAEEFRSVLEKYRDVSRVASTGRQVRTRVPAGVPARVVREWAVQNGHEVPAKGRIPAEVREAFDAAH